MDIWTDGTTIESGKLRAILASDGYTDVEGTYYPTGWNKDEIADLVRVRKTSQPEDAGLIVTGTWSVEMVGSEPTQVWETRTAPTAPTLGRDDAVADRRWQAEIGGVTWNGWPVATDRDSQAKVNAAYVMARDGYWTAGAGWKFTDGVFRPLTGDQVVTMALAVAAHVQACFAHEAALIADATADINEGWPG